MKIIVGYSGFVGSNLCKYIKFDAKYNSKNIVESYNTNPDLLIYCGVRGTKFIANEYPEQDRNNIKDAINNIELINPKCLVLISTVDVYDDYTGYTEDYNSNVENLHTYGKNRLELEKWVIEHIDNYHIIRIPALYGINLKKNFVFDLIHPIPVFLKENIIKNIEKEFPNIYEYYQQTNENLYMFDSEKEDRKINGYFKNSKYNSIYFTDSRAMYQFFNLNRLSDIIDYVIDNNIRIFNAVTEPIKASELYYKLYQKEFINEISDKPIMYNLHTKYAKDFNSKYYISDKKSVLIDLLDFIKSQK